MKNAHFNLKLEPALKKQLQTAAKEMDVSVAWLLRHAVKQFLASQKKPVADPHKS